ncbi:MAG: CheR family methyltransferase [Deltaproteobacteria bacterium]|nr:CheR family methyltransferase [Deltaproteobacteria bacterium]
MADPGADAALLRALAERDVPRRRHLVRTIEIAQPQSIGNEVLRQLESSLRGGDIDARLAASDVLSGIGNAALPLLRRLLEDPGPGVRRLAVDALGCMTGSQALALLDSAASDTSVAVRSAALDGITRIGGPLAEAALQRQLSDDNVPASVALAALLGLEQLGASSPVGGTGSALSTPRLKRWLEDPLTAGAALRLLGRSGDVDAILPSLSSKSMTRQRAAVIGLAEALERGSAVPPVLLVASTAKPIKEALLHHLTRGDLVVASAAVIVLGHLGDLSPVATAVMREDRSRLLPALHRVVELCGRTDAVAPRLHALALLHPDAAEELLELAAAAGRQAGAIPRTTTGSRRQRPVLGEAEFLRLSRWFERTAGLLLTFEARARVEARLAMRLEVTGRHDFNRYIALLESGDVDERAAAIESVTVHETYFFREPATLDGFRDELVPALADRKRPFRVWSAGCSTGEEAFTLAILLEGLRVRGAVADYEVWGTDVSPGVLARARAALYQDRSFRRALTAEEAPWFVDGEKGRSPIARVQRQVRFENVNLVDDAAVAALPIFDVVFCRNVLIYFSPAARARAVDAFHDRLRPGGALVLGHSESLLHVENPFTPWPLRRGLAYRRSLLGWDTARFARTTTPSTSRGTSSVPSGRVAK